MATIASLAVQLSASPAGLIAGLAKARNAVASTGSHITAAAARANSVLSSIGSSAAGGDFAGALRTSVDAAGQLGSKLSFVAGIASGLPVIGMAMGAGIGAAASAANQLISSLGKIKSLFDEGAAKILEQRSAAITLGESFSETAALAMAAGGDVERMTRAMVHLNETVQSARVGDSGALALLAGKLRLNPENMAMMGTAQRLEAVIKSLGSLNDELTKSSVELGIFGERSALAFGPLLSSGNGLAKFREQVERFGFSLGGGSAGEMKAMADRVLEAKRAVNQLGMAWQGIKMNLAAGLAPVLAKTAELFSNLGVDAKRIQSWSVNGAMLLAKGGAGAYESWKTLEGLWYHLEHGFLRMVIGMETGLQSLLERIDQLPSSLRGMQGAIGGLAGAAIQAGWAPVLNQVAGLFIKSREMSRDIGQDIKGLMRSADEVAKKINERRKARSAFDDVNDWFANMQRDIDKRKQLAEKAESTRRNYEPIRAPIQLAGAAEFGSQEAYKTLGMFAAGQNADVAQKQLVQQQRIEQAIQKGDVTLKDIKSILKRHGVVKVGKI